MSAQDQKAVKRSAKRPRADRTLLSDDFQNPDAVAPADNPAVDTRELSSCSLGSDVQETREPVEKRAQDFKGDYITRILETERKQFEKNINASFRSLSENLQNIFKTQQESRKKLHSLYSKMFWPLYQQWLEEVEKAREQEESLTLITKQQMKILEEAISDHEVKLENAKDMCDTVLKKAKNLREHHKTFIGGHYSEVEKEISKAQDRVIMKTQEQDVSVVETYFQSLVLDSSEETI
ncbi:X-linked lymphocyte-regulated protein 5C-like [Meriones unguiculatus]|uniref:X-linked lymphocyte-regulated protein 5C-like n=1 Tax=Meriones unguiculatus TaxID=10047 RepID=UPI000B4F44FA|nr:X-linked lymphocyte-regulated protein 5C-like [Meriones unguiculatus]